MPSVPSSSVKKRWNDSHRRKYDNQLVSADEIQPQFASQRQVLLRKTPTDVSGKVPADFTGTVSLV